MVLGCRPGFRWVAGSEPASPVACSASSKYQQRFRCNDCQLTPVQVGQCVPVACPAYTSADPNVDSWAPVPGGSSGAATPSQTPYGLELEVQCKVGYRAESSASCSDSLCTAETARSFRVTCSASCAYTPGRRCLPVTCGGLSFLKNAAFETLSAAQPVMEALQRVCAVSSACVFATIARVRLHIYVCMNICVCSCTSACIQGRPYYQVGDRVRGTCNVGFRAQLPQPTSGGAVTIEHEAALPAGPCQNKTFDMTCGDSGAWLNLRSCVPITCPKPAATGGHNASTEPAGRLAFGQAFHAEVAHCPEGHRPNVSLPLPICNDSCQLSGSQCRPVDC
ncbi:MAG: hypothetical protein ACPIOQ_61295, partial [Promethearchaeia archaeon]